MLETTQEIRSGTLARHSFQEGAASASIVLSTIGRVESQTRFHVGKGHDRPHSLPVLRTDFRIRLHYILVNTITRTVGFSFWEQLLVCYSELRFAEANEANDEIVRSFVRRGVPYRRSDSTLDVNS